MKGPGTGRRSRGNTAVAVLQPREPGVLLAGVPPHCSGFVMLQNPSKHPVRVKGLYLETPSRAALQPPGCEPVILLQQASVPSEATGEGGAGVDNAQGATGGAESCGDEPRPSGIPVPVFAKLQACEELEVNVALRIAMTTRPGTYEGTLVDRHGGSCPALVQVFELRRVRFHPQTIPRAVQPGETLNIEVQVRNVGNVAAELPDGFAVRLAPADETWHRHFHRAAAGTGEQGHVAVLDDFMGRLGASELPPIKGRLVLGSGQLLPGAGRSLQVEFTVPKKLPRGRRFNALVRLAYGALTVQLTVLDAAPTEEPG